MRGGYYFAVVTDAPQGEGNLAAAIDTYMVVDFASPQNNYRDTVAQLAPQHALGLRQPVFHVGEILILDLESGREVGYPGRKPAKWQIEIEEFGMDLHGAIARAAEVFGESLREQAAKDES